jgi:outer membrane receptor protein involved in Fe transport
MQMRYLLTFLCISCFISVFAQENGRLVRIRGTVKDKAGIAVPYASVTLHQQADSSMVDGAVSDETGTFDIGAKPGTYYLKISFLSFEEKFIPSLILTMQDVVLDDIVLNESAKMLDEVTVTGERSQMELQLDKRVFNVGKDLANTGGNAADILNNIPSVSVEADGTVSLRGSENVRILINGKPSGLTMRDPDALRQLQSNLVERVEVITNPSSRYEAQGEVGIINIVLKKNQENGLNGTFTASAGHPDLLGGSYSLNMRRKKFNLFSSYGTDYRSAPGYSKSYQDFKNGFTDRRNTDRISSELSHTVMGGLDYFINDNTSVTGSVMYNSEGGLTKSKLTYSDFLNDELQASSVRTDREVADEKNLEAALAYKKDFEKKGQTLTAELQFIDNDDAETSDYTQASADENIIQRAENISHEQNWFIQADYVHPLSKNGKGEAGIRSTTRIVDNDYALEQQESDGTWTVLPAFNNNMIYTERIHAAYIMAGEKFNRVSLQAGLRGEYSDITTELTETFQVNHRAYFNLFPSVNAGLEITKDKTFQLSYSRRINRPRFRDLIPFSNFTDTRSLFIGNPALNPEYTNAFEAGYLVNWENGSILSSAYYRLRHGVIQRITQSPDSLGRTLIVPVNLAKENAYGLEFNFSLNVKSWWQINSSANFYHAITEGKYQENVLRSDAYSLNTRTTSKITFSKGFDFQAAFNYRAPRITPQGRQLSNYAVDLALAKDIFKGKGTITANVRDLLNTRKNRSITDIEDYYSESESQGRPRQLMFTFTYRLNQAKQKQRNGDRGDGNDEGGEDF